MTDITPDCNHPALLRSSPSQVRQRAGRTPGAGDLGWKGTLDLKPGETADVSTRFGDHPDRFVFHCHNLEHQDMAMMVNFAVS